MSIYILWRITHVNRCKVVAKEPVPTEHPPAKLATAANFCFSISERIITPNQVPNFLLLEFLLEVRRHETDYYLRDVTQHGIENGSLRYSFRHNPIDHQIRNR